MNWIEPILSSSKEENVLVLLKYQDPFLEDAAFKSCLSCSKFPHYSMDWVSIPVPIQAIAFLRITSM